MPRALSRRGFVLAGAVAGCSIALSGCSWTPRNAAYQDSSAQEAAAPQSPAQEGQAPLQESQPAASSSTLAEPTAAPPVDDGLTLVTAGTFTMPIATFLESYDFSGKKIRPFSSNGGGGLGQSISAISKLAPTAQVGQGLTIYYSGGPDLPQRVADWIASA